MYLPRGFTMPFTSILICTNLYISVLKNEDLFARDLRKISDQFSRGKYIKQLNSRFSRLYTTPKEYDNLRTRIRYVKKKKLKPLSTRSYNSPDTSARGIIDEVLNIHNRQDLYVACSGGRDSISCANWIEQNYPKQLKGLVFIETHIGHDELRPWLEDYCKRRKWKLEIADSGTAYKDYVMKYGFPGTSSHSMIMRRLKLSTLRKHMISDEYRKNNHCMISGTRKFESKRRFNNVTPINVDDRLYFCSPFYLRTNDWIHSYIKRNNLEISPAYEDFDMSLDCGCGSFGDKKEREKIRKCTPKLNATLKWLEDNIKKTPEMKSKYCLTWGKGADRGDPNNPKPKRKYAPLLEADPISEVMICSGECGANTMRGELEGF